MKRKHKHSLAYRNEFITGRVGIRARILCDLALFVGFVISLVWFCQIVLLFDFYRNYKSGQVSETASILVENIDNENLSDLADRLSAENEVCMLLLNDHGQPVISVDHVRYCLIHRMSPEILRQWCQKAEEEPQTEMLPVTPFRNENYRRDHFHGWKLPDENSDSGLSMLYVQKVMFADGKTGTLFLNSMITPFGTTLDTLRRQFVLIAAMILFSAILMGVTMSRRLSAPLIETNEAAKQLSHGRYSRPPHSGGYREIAELNDTLVSAAEELNRVDDLQKELIANISHDLRTPLTMIQGYAETMRDIPDEVTPENMQIIIDETNRLSSLVNQILDFSRLQGGQMKIDKKVFDLTRHILEIIYRIGGMVAAEGYTVRFEPEDSVKVYADPDAIGQVIYNLIGNALTYTGSDKNVFVEQQCKENRVRIIIRDTGKGIEPGELEFIWERYYRTKDTHKRAVIGSGLGLSIVRGILERHEAKYGVESEEGKGTSFWFELPVMEEERETL